MRISDWSSDVCSSDLDGRFRKRLATRCVADRVKIWKTAIGQFVRFEMIICERKLRRTVDADGHRRRNAPTFLPDRVPASHILIMPHSIDAESNKVVNAIIYIGSGALVIGVPHADCASSECFRHRKFGNDVKRSACAAASAQCRIRSTNDLYLFNREHFARLRRRIANPVDKSAPLTVEAANEGPVDRAHV